MQKIVILLIVLLHLFLLSLNSCKSTPPPEEAVIGPEFSEIPGQTHLLHKTPEYVHDYQIADWKDFKKAACSFTFDDGTLDQYLIAYPEMEKLGINATFFLITGYVEQGYWDDGNIRRLLFSWDNARELYRNGHEIGSHSLTHPDFTRKTTDDIGEMSISSEIIQNEIVKNRGITFCWPYWRSSEESRKTAGDYFIGARGGGCSAENYLEISEKYKQDQTIADFYQINSFAVLRTTPDQSIGDLCTTVYDSNGWFIPSFHGIDSNNIDRNALGWEAIPTERFREIALMVKEHDFWIAPFGKVLRYIRERDSAVLSLHSAERDIIRIKLEDELDDEVYNQPLSIRIVLPSTWKKIRLSQNGNFRYKRTDKSGQITFSAFPDGNMITIFKYN